MFSKTTGINYSELQKLLEEKKWVNAAEKTWKLMLKATNRQKKDWLTLDNCKNFPREDLKIIDDLWVKYSAGKFGFSIQKQIFIDCGGIPGEEPTYDIYCKFAEQVGWIKEGRWINPDEIIYNITAKSGHLPAKGFGLLGLCGGRFLDSFLLSNI